PNGVDVSEIGQIVRDSELASSVVNNVDIAQIIRLRNDAVRAISRRHLPQIDDFNAELQESLILQLPDSYPLVHGVRRFPATYFYNIDEVKQFEDTFNRLSDGHSNVRIVYSPVSLWCDALGTVNGKNIDSTALRFIGLPLSFEGCDIFPISINN